LVNVTFPKRLCEIWMIWCTDEFGNDLKKFIVTSCEGVVNL
jgi:hypothetical protein